jgi:hypothetical protein
MSEKLSLTLREIYRLGIFENIVLRRILGRKMEEVTGGWRKLHSEGFHDMHIKQFHGMYSSPNIT